MADLKQEQRRLQQELSKKPAGGAGRGGFNAPAPGGMKKGASNKLTTSFNPADEENSDPFNSFAAAGGRGRAETIAIRKRPSRMSSAVVENQHWLSNDLEEKVKNFDEIRKNFINDLTNQMSNLMVQPQRERAATMAVSKRPALTPVLETSKDQE